MRRRRALNLICSDVQAVLLDGPVRADGTIGARGVVVPGVDVARDRNIARDVGKCLRAVGGQGAREHILEVSVRERELRAIQTQRADRTGCGRRGVRRTNGVEERTAINVAGASRACTTDKQTAECKSSGSAVGIGSHLPVHGDPTHSDRLGAVRRGGGGGREHGRSAVDVVCDDGIDVGACRHAVRGA